MELTVLCLSFVVFLLLGVPVAFAIGLSCLATFAVEGLPFETAIQMMVSGMNVFSFLAIPFFIFSGELMLHGGIADKIVNFARTSVPDARPSLARQGSKSGREVRQSAASLPASRRTSRPDSRPTRTPKA